MTDFLDRLAMEVAEWGNGFTKDPMRWEAICDEVVENSMLKKSPVGWLAFNDDGDRAAVHQWLQRRKELINEPDDADAPEWAEWKAQDRCGSWYWYDKKPTIGGGIWLDGGHWSGSNNGKIPAGHDWRTTLKEVKRKAKVYDNLHEDVKESGFLDHTNQTLEAQLYAVRELALAVDAVDDHVVSLMLKKAIKQILERELDVDFSDDEKEVEHEQ